VPGLLLLLLGLLECLLALLQQPVVCKTGMPTGLCALLGQGQRRLLLLLEGVCSHHCGLQGCCIWHEQLGLQLLLQVLEHLSSCRLQQGVHGSRCHSRVLAGRCWQGAQLRQGIQLLLHGCSISVHAGKSWCGRLCKHPYPGWDSRWCSLLCGMWCIP
jgi:hypothetical protein